MTSKKALDNLRFDVLMLHNIDYIRTNNECDIIEKDLEVLEILKKYLYYDNKNHCIKMKQVRKSTFNFDYEDLKEWLQHDSQTND